jgi:uncharacterized membrane protein YcjF (UPF0283 family)
MRAGLLAFALFVVGALVTLIEIWFEPWAHETFLKLVASDAILIVIVAAWAFFVRERRATEKLKNDTTLR